MNHSSVLHLHQTVDSESENKTKKCLDIFPLPFHHEQMYLGRLLRPLDLSISRNGLHGQPSLIFNNLLDFTKFIVQRIFFITMNKMKMSYIVLILALWVDSGPWSL